MQKQHISVFLVTLGFVLINTELIAQTSYEYVGGYPCLGAQILVNAQLVVTDPPPSPFVASWTITSPSGVVITESDQDTIVVSFDEIECWEVILFIDGLEVQNDPCGVRVFEDPVAAINPISLTGCVPFCPEIENATVLGTGTIPSYLWDIGFCPLIFDENIDGQCCINVPGTYDIFMSVTDENGCFDQFELQDAIVVSDSPPNASFVASSLYDCNSPVDIGFYSNSTTANPELTYSWTVDGATVGSDNDTLDFTFLAPGSYEVCLEVIDALGCSESICETVEIFDTPIPDFSIDPATICAGMTVSFENLSSPLPIPTVEWDFDGDGLIDAAGDNVDYSYNTSGNYDAELFITYSDHCADSLTQLVTVDPPIEALFEVDTLYGCSLPFTIELADLSSGTGALTYDWFIIDSNGDQTFFSPMAGQYTFTTWGTYQIGLTLTNSIGCFDQYIFPQDVILIEPQLEFNLSAPSNCVGDIISTNIYLEQSLQPFINWYYDVQCDGAGPLDQEILNSTDGNTMFTFPSEGTYDICLTAESANGCTDSWQSSITIAPEIFSTFTVSDANPCGIDTVSFTATTPSPSVTYEWLTGDGNSSNPILTPSYEYSYCDTGFFDVTLLLSNMGCNTSYSIDSLIYVPVPIANFSILTNCVDYYTIQLENQSIMPDTAETIWTIDGIQMYFGEWEPSHTFTAEGTHEISLYVYNDSTGCADVKTQSVKINEPSFEVFIGPTTGCPPVLVDIVPLDTECVVNWDVELEGSDFLSAEPGMFQPWDMEWYLEMSNGSSSDTIINWPLVAYTALGQYDISMTIQDVNGCSIDTTYEDIISIDIDPFFAQFDTTVTYYCDSVVVEANPLIPDLMDWAWSTNTGLTDTTENVSFTFYPPYNQNQGSIVSLNASLPGGCFSTVRDTLFLPRPIDACASISDENPCKDELVFLDASCTICDLPPCIYSWDLDDDGIYDDANTDTTSISWLANGNYPISLSVIDSLGCLDEWSGLITVHSPEIELMYNDTVIACQAYVTIESTTLGPGLSSSWSFSGFDDQGVIAPYNEDLPSAAPQIFAFNEQAIGVYDIDVTITNQYGCSSDSSLTDILGYAGALGDFACILDSLDCAPMSIHCESFDPSDDELDYIWNMGDNTAYTSTIVDHEYHIPGIFPVSLTITDPENLCLFNVFGDTISVTQLQFDFDGVTTVCPGDSSFVEVVGLDSLVWSSPLGQISELTSESWFLTPNSDTDFVATGFLEGCYAKDTMTVNNFMLPTFSVDPFGPFCMNEGVIDLPVISPTGGVYEWNGNSVTSLITDSIGASTDTVNYLFMDFNSCESIVEVDFSILDTTTVETFPSNLCIDAPALDLNSVVSDTPALFFIDYGTGSYESQSFLTDSLVNFTDVATSYFYDYEYVNSNGCLSTLGGEIVVHPLPIAQFSVDELCLNDTLSLLNQSTISTGALIEYEWEFWNGLNSNQSMPSDVLANQQGLLEINLQVTSDQQCVSIYTDSVNVLSLPVLLAEPYLPICKNVGAIPLPNISPAGGDYSMFGDILSGDLDTYELDTLNQIDYYYVDANGCSNDISVNVVILDTTNISLILPDRCINSPALDLSSLSSHGAGQFMTDYGNGILDTIDAFDPGSILSYPMLASSYEVNYQYINSDDCLSSIVSEVIVHPIPQLEYTATEICENDAIEFIQLSTIGSGIIEEYSWSISGHPEIFTAVPSGITYDTYGVYAITLSATSDQGCVTSISDSLYVHPYPEPDFFTSDICENEEVTIVNSSSIAQGSIVTIEYDWGDDIESSSLDANHSHLYSGFGIQDILMTLVSDKGCVVNDSMSVDIHPSPIPLMTIEDHCFGVIGEGTNLSTIPEGVIVEISYEIPIENAEYVGDLFSHLFSTPSDFSIILTVTSDEGCTGQEDFIVTVHDLPLPAFGTDGSPSCTGDEVVLYDFSSITAPYSIDSVTWSVLGEMAFGDESIWIFHEPGQIEVQMEVYSNEGCVASLSQVEEIEIIPSPFSAFTLSPSNPSIAIPLVQMIDLSVGATTWDYFVDGSLIGSEQSLSYEFMETGEYEVWQIVSFENLCFDSSMVVTNVLPALIIYVPNAVTFDGDGYNDFFFPVISGDEITKYELRIFDRWGQVVFQSKDPQEKWNGSVQNGSYYAMDEVYNWQLLISGQHTPIKMLSGTITALR